MPISLHHAQVFYPPGEEPKARAFHGTALGLAEIPRPDDPFGNRIELDEIPATR